MTELNLQIVEWSALECEKQRSGEVSVYWMLQGWDYACAKKASLPDIDDIMKLGALVEPRKASDGFRRGGVRVGFDVKGPAKDVPRKTKKLVAALDAIPFVDADEWYRQYEEIHPFTDGNGRTGSILWNWIRGTLDYPEAPPDFWKDDHIKQSREMFERVLIAELQEKDKK